MTVLIDGFLCEQVQPIQTRGPLDPRERVLVTALRATLSADDEQHKAAAPVKGTAHDQGSGPSGALLGAQHMAGGLDAAEDSDEGPARLPPAASEHGNLPNSQREKSLLDTHASNTGPRGIDGNLPVGSEFTGTITAAQSSGGHRPLPLIFKHMPAHGRTKHCTAFSGLKCHASRIAKVFLKSDTCPSIMKYCTRQEHPIDDAEYQNDD